MNNGMTIDSDSLRQLGNSLISEGAALVGMVESARAKINGSASIYESTSAVAFRNKMNTFADNAEKGIDQNFQALADAFNTVAQVSDTTEEDVTREADKYLATELFENVE